MALLICKLLTGTYKAVSQFKRRRSILILVAVFLQHNINDVMYRKEDAGDSLNNKLERQSHTEFAIVSLTVFSIILSCVTKVPVRHGRGGGGRFGNCDVFLAHNYISEQFGNYVEYGNYKYCRLWWSFNGLGVIQVLRNADGGGGCQFSGKSPVTKV